MTIHVSEKADAVSGPIDLTTNLFGQSSEWALVVTSRLRRRAEELLRSLSPKSRPEDQTNRAIAVQHKASGMTDQIYVNFRCHLDLSQYFLTVG